MSRSWWNVAICFGLCILIASAAVSAKTPVKSKIKAVTNAQNLTQENENRNITTKDNDASDQLRAYRMREVGVGVAPLIKIHVLFF